MLGADGAIYPFGEAAQLRQSARLLRAGRPSTSNPPRRGGLLGPRRQRCESAPSATPPTTEGSPAAVLGPGEVPTSLSAHADRAGLLGVHQPGPGRRLRRRPLPRRRLGARRSTGPSSTRWPHRAGRATTWSASDGGIFAFGDARFSGSMGGKRLNAPVQSLVPDVRRGRLLAGRVGRRDLRLRRAVQGVDGRRNRWPEPVTGMVRYGDGYLMVGEDGGIFNFSSLGFAGSLGGQPAGRARSCRSPPCPDGPGGDPHHRGTIRADLSRPRVAVGPTDTGGFAQTPNLGVRASLSTDPAGWPSCRSSRRRRSAPRVPSRPATRLQSISGAGPRRRPRGV